TGASSANPPPRSSKSAQAVPTDDERAKSSSPRPNPPASAIPIGLATAVATRSPPRGRSGLANRQERQDAKTAKRFEETVTRPCVIYVFAVHSRLLGVSAFLAIRSPYVLP